MSNKLTVKFWDGTSKEAATRDEAVSIVKEGLQAWMEKGDKILWFQLPEDTKLLSHAFVKNELGEETDARAIIKEDKISSETKELLEECLKEIDEYRLKQACKGDPRDYAIRVCQAIIAKKAGYTGQNRMETPATRGGIVRCTKQYAE